MQMNCFHCPNNRPIDDLFYCKSCNEITCHRCLLKNHKTLPKHELEEVSQNCLPALVEDLMHEAKFFDAHDPTVKSLMAEVENIEGQISCVKKVAQQYLAANTKSHTSDLENSINEGTLTLEQFEKYRGLIKKNKDELQMAAAKLDKEATNQLTSSVSSLRDKLYDLDRNMRRAAVLEKSLGLGNQETILLIGGEGQSNYMADVIALQHKAKDSFKCFPTPELVLKTERYYHQSVLINGSVITMGGYNGQFLSSVECIDLRTHSKCDIPSMINARRKFAAGIIGNRVYVCGGWNGTNLLSLCEYYDTEAQKWNNFRNLNHARNAHGGAIINGIFYITGGYTQPNVLISVESYDPAVHRWTDCPSLQQERCLHGCVALESQLYVCGGCYGGTSCERFDKRDNKWSPCANMNRGGELVGLFPIGGKLYAIDIKNNIEMYEPRNDKWTLFENVLETTKGMSAVVI